MAFCMYCGKQLEDGEVCTCNAVPTEQVVNVQQEGGTGNPFMDAGQANGGMSFGEAQQGYWNGQSQQMYEQNPQSQQGYQQQMYQQNPQQQGYQQNPQMQQMFQQNSQQFNEMKEKSSMYLKELLNNWLCILKQPVSMGRQFVTMGSKSIAIGLLAIQAILTAIFGCVLAGKFNGTLESAFFSSMDSYSDLGSRSSELDSYLLNLPTVFVLSLIASLITSFALAGLLLAGVKICKGNNVNYKSMLCAVGVRAVGISVLQVVTIVLSLFSVTWSIACFLIAGVIGLLLLVPVVSTGSGMDENKLGYMLFVVLIVSGIVSGILAKVLVPMYVPSVYEDTIENVEGDLYELMDVLGELGSLAK